MNHEQKAEFVRQWISELSRDLQRRRDTLTTLGLRAYDFGGHVRIEFEDGSIVDFRHAFFVQKRDEPGHIAVFTEHCGYHEFWIGQHDQVTQL